MSDTFRRAYRELTDAEKEHVEQIKDAAERLEKLLDGIRPRYVAAADDDEQARCVALAETNLEQAVMWALKAAT